MSGSFFLDTSIFVYSFDRHATGKARKARELIREAITSGAGVVSYQVVQEFFSVALRKFARPMTVEEAGRYLETVFRPLLAIHSSEMLYRQALGFQARRRASWYDSLILASALEAGCKLLYSEDFGHGEKFGELRVENPFRVAD